MRVVIWQGEKNRVGRLAYMYWPVMGTLIGGFLEAAPSVQLEVGVGFSLRYHAALARLRRGDALVWVGVNGQYSQPWTKLRARGVKTILYNTEPSGLSRRSPLCTATRYAVDELWDFSRYNLDRCARSYNRPNRTRYLPPGYLGRRAAERSSPQQARPPEARSGVRRSLLFYGALESRGDCFGRLKRSLGDELEHTYSVWNESAFGEMLSKHDLFVNLHKGCRTGDPVTFRVPVLLNEGKLILSDRAYSHDEDEFKGMVLFAGVGRLADAYRALRATDTAPLQRHAARLFAARFAPRETFRRAGLYEEWGLRLQS